MKKCSFNSLILIFFLVAKISNAQIQKPKINFQFKGKVVYDSIDSPSLKNNMGEKSKRALAIYLPPDYQNSKKSYPVIYFLHGFNADHMVLNEFYQILDYAIEQKKIKPFIMVVSDQKTTYLGSFYSNSDHYGHWEDFTTYDLVSFIDKNYKTIPKAESRGITGHSMGGYGALKIAMHHPEVFSSVYAISPGALDVVREYGPNSDTFKVISSYNSYDDIKPNHYFSHVMLAFAKSWSSNPNKPPFYCEMPFEFKGDELIVHKDILKKWHNNMPVYMLEDNLENLQKLRAIKMDWGRNAGLRFTQQCKIFSQRLENLGISHFAEEYIGTHVSDIYTINGRIQNAVLPFFNDYLEFE